MNPKGSRLKPDVGGRTSRSATRCDRLRRIIRQVIRLGTLWILTTSGSLLGAAQQLDEATVIEQGRAAVVLLTRGRSTTLIGSGFVLNQHHVVTNLHVVAGREPIDLIISSDQRIEAEVIYPGEEKREACHRMKSHEKQMLKKGVDWSDVFEKSIQSGSCIPDLAILRTQEPTSRSPSGGAHRVAADGPRCMGFWVSRSG